LQKWPRLDVVAIPEEADGSARFVDAAEARHPRLTADNNSAPVAGQVPNPGSAVTPTERRATPVGRARRVLKIAAWIFVAFVVLVSPVVAYR
jgi:hypothetical protein